jgi:hypothetical protein
MKKLFFVRKFSLAGSSISTLEVDLAAIEQALPEGARIKSETVQTQIEGDTFIVYGEYTTEEQAMQEAQEAVAQETINLDEVLGDGGMLPSVN